MDFLTGKLKSLYFKYLAAAFGSALVTSIYSIVDMAIVGQYQGPDGTAALAVVAPIWNIIFSLGLLMGIGGSIILSTLRGQRDGHHQYENEYFSSAVIGSTALGLIMWVLLIFFDKELFIFFGAKGNLLALAQTYIIPIKFVLPCFLFTQMLAAFLRNDNAPTLATIGVLLGGIFNIFGDYFFVFTLDMGIFGAGLATAIGSVISCIIMLTHFLSKENTLHFVIPKHILQQLQKIVITGFSTFFIDIAMGILTILFNRQIMAYLGSQALSIYGIIVNISTFVQCCAYSVGQASQPIISTNFGAKFGHRIKETLKYALYSVAFFSILWTALALLVPNMFVKIFMTPTQEILQIAPPIIRMYGLSFLLLPFNIFSTYYFQALLKPKTSFVISVGRGLVLSGILIYLLPLINADYLWLTMPITEFIVAIYAVIHMRKCTKSLPIESRS
ncbi:MATE family efflux transporter [Longibaculum muris]|uniref:Putative MATE family efflux protein n=1 Tax=Longibaculum muris TaxID=1796628 RepID=A0A4R3Z4C2_9FIRM|nr:MATE family efflux transporter [Longibaculum muris]KXU49944.1 MATE efflux family protein [Candidatus Stoquefichus sp. KLE1796]MBS5368092.1 polysaccharide biosynthesis C-terminal domain-containing protein [Coprobacillus cateniformis]MCR1887504.1 MATE family efflux transporter [Longibaculum muris]MED9811778.1 MATE family efflux transporter [Longibaculum muris]TCW00779.1 putative MATE family efflux protein [Longibaculum muris]